MRRWLLLVMVLLLPLRGWVGEAMAGEMLQQHVAAMSSQHHAAPAPAAHDCDHHGSAAAPAEVDEAAQQPMQPDGDCATCASCQACSSVALWPPLPVLDAPTAIQSAPHGGQGSFSSAEPVLAFKPPRA